MLGTHLEHDGAIVQEVSQVHGTRSQMNNSDSKTRPSSAPRWNMQAYSISNAHRSRITSRRPLACDVHCRPKTFLLFSAKYLVANDAAKLDATIDQAARGLTDGVGW